MSLVLLVGIVLVVIVILHPPYRIKRDCVIAFTGGLGSGKTFTSVNIALRVLRKNQRATKLYNLLHRQRLPMPVLYSSIPVLVGKDCYSERLTADILTLQTRIIPGSVCLLDEIDSFANQWAYANPNIIKQYRKGEEEDHGGLFDDFIRFFRHYNSSPACEPVLICNTQAVENIVTVVRRRINSYYQLSHIRFFDLIFFKFYICNIRHLSFSEDLVTTSSGDVDDGECVLYGFCSVNRRFDTHCYSGRVSLIDHAPSDPFHKLKSNQVSKCPVRALPDKQLNDDSQP